MAPVLGIIVIGAVGIITGNAFVGAGFLITSLISVFLLVILVIMWVPSLYILIRVIFIVGPEELYEQGHELVYVLMDKQVVYG